MKLVIDIADNTASSFMQLIEGHYLEAKTLSAPEASLLEEIQHIQDAFKYAEDIKTGKLKTRPVEDLLNEL